MFIHRKLVDDCEASFSFSSDARRGPASNLPLPHDGHERARDRPVPSVRDLRPVPRSQFFELFAGGGLGGG